MNHPRGSPDGPREEVTNMRIKRPITLAASLIVLVGVAAGMPQQAGAELSPLQYWMAGTRHAENKLYIDAIEDFSRAIRTNKGDLSIEDIARVFDSRGLAYHGLGEDDKALSDFNNAIDLDDKNAELFLHRGQFYLDREQFGKAQDDFSAVVKLSPKGADGYEGRGRASLGAGDHAEAIADFEKVLTLEPRNYEVLYSLGLAYKRAGKDGKAHEAFDRLIKAVESHPAASYHKAGLFAREKKIDSACVWLGIAVEEGFRDWPALKNDGDFDSIRKNPCYLKVVAGK